MSVWAVPLTWVNGAPTAAQMNSISTGLTWLKAWADIVTNSTASDTGDTTYLWVKRTGAAATAFRASVTGDSTPPRLEIDASGKMSWSSGAAASDINLARSAAAVLALSNGRLEINNAEGIGIDFPNGEYIQFDERSADPAAPAVNVVRLYAKDNGAGRTQLLARFATGVVQQIAIQP